MIVQAPIRASFAYLFKKKKKKKKNIKRVVLKLGAFTLIFFFFAYVHYTYRCIEAHNFHITEDMMYKFCSSTILKRL